jgi:formylglycine-generating enzyme required for sulfatase activity/predicted  nucleic acid-binding Zn-ribbon protein
MRYGLSALVLAMVPSLASLPTLAQIEPSQTPTAIQSTLFEKNSELQDAKEHVSEIQTRFDNQIAETSRLSKQINSLETKLAKAKSQLSADYAKMIDEPELDITPSQQHYQSAWNDVKKAQSDLLASQQKQEEIKNELSEAKAIQHQVELTIHELSEKKKRARVALLREEIQKTGTETVSYVNTCASDMTLDACKKQTLNLAIQKAVGQFKSNVISNTSESQIVLQNQASASLNIHVSEYSEGSSRFFDQNRYKTTLKVGMTSKPADNAACKLLDLDSKYCFAPSLGEEQSQSVEIAWHTVMIRSSQFDDRVTIDGVRYGSTPIEVMLSGGTHQITIEKEGYKSFSRQFTIGQDQTIRANLVAKSNAPKAGETFADYINKNTNAPEMSVVTAGTFLVGENAAKQVTLSKGFALGIAPVTVEEFNAFVTATGYKTDAELTHICTTIDEATIVPVAGNNWQSPGYKQNTDYPVVCVSKNDANAYANWLSKQTGYKYRLPSEDEWEIASRAGSTDAYWWGSDFGVGRANTGWGGTPWSNQSASPVKSFAANHLGMYDMVGNVWEWTADPKGILKGGAWSFSADKAKSEAQLFISPSSAANFAGFRVLREL